MPLRTIIIKATRSGTASTVIIRRGASGTGTGGTGDHGALTGLGDDDHTQYLNNARGDARYPLGSGTSNGTNTGDQDLSSYASTSALAGKANLSGTNNFTATQTFAQPVYLSGAVMGTVTTPIAGAYNGPGTGLTGTAQDLIVGQAFTANALTSVLPITSGGTGAASESTARTALGLGATDAVQFGVISTTAQPVRIPLVYSNASDFTTASTAFQNVTGLSFPVLANKTYAITYWLMTNKNDSNGLQLQFTGPASVIKTMIRSFIATNSALNNTTADIFTAFSIPSVTGNTFNGDGWMTAAGGTINNGPNAGTVQLQIKAITGGTAKIYAGSYIQITEL